MEEIYNFFIEKEKRIDKNLNLLKENFIMHKDKGKEIHLDHIE